RVRDDRLGCLVAQRRIGAARRSRSCDLGIGQLARDRSSTGTLDRCRSDGRFRHRRAEHVLTLRRTGAWHDARRLDTFQWARQLVRNSRSRAGRDRFLRVHRGRATTMKRAALLIALLASCSAHAAHARRPADVLIRGGLVYTGAEADPKIVDVVLVGDKVAYVGDDAASRFNPAHTIDAQGKIVAPGFIDPHTHPDSYIRSKDRAQRRNALWLMQGVTTIGIGVDGGGSFEVAKQRAWFEGRGVGTNLAAYVGFDPVRESVLGQQARAPNAQELTRMRQ